LTNPLGTDIVEAIKLLFFIYQPYVFEMRIDVAGSTYKIIELVGTSDSSWEEAVKTAIETAGESLRDLRIAEITKLDVIIENGKVTSYRARINVSFKYLKDD
jgi:flavin-binding protein dodecin